MTGYRAERAESADGPWTQVALVGPDIPISATVDGPVDVPLWFRVAAVNAVADGMPTVIDLTLRNAPDQVIGLEATLLSGDVMLTWDPVAEPSDDAEITYYVERALAGDDIYWPIGETDELLFTDTTALGTHLLVSRLRLNGVNDGVRRRAAPGCRRPASAPLSITPTGVPGPDATSAAVAVGRAGRGAPGVDRQPGRRLADPALRWSRHQPLPAIHGCSPTSWPCHDSDAGLAINVAIASVSASTPTVPAVAGTRRHARRRRPAP